MVAGAAVQKFMMSFDKEQEIIMNIGGHGHQYLHGRKCAVTCR